MNKIHKVIFNKTLGRFVVASENTKSRTKSSKLKLAVSGAVVAISAITSTVSTANTIIQPDVNDGLYISGEGNHATYARDTDILGNENTVIFSENGGQKNNLIVGSNNTLDLERWNDNLHANGYDLANVSIIGGDNNLTNSEQISVVGSNNSLKNLIGFSLTDLGPSHSLVHGSNNSVVLNDKVNPDGNISTGNADSFNLTGVNNSLSASHLWSTNINGSDNTISTVNQINQVNLVGSSNSYNASRAVGLNVMGFSNKAETANVLNRLNIIGSINEFKTVNGSLTDLFVGGSGNIFSMMDNGNMSALSVIGSQNRFSALHDNRFTLTNVLGSANKITFTEAYTGDSATINSINVVGSSNNVTDSVGGILLSNQSAVTNSNKVLVGGNNNTLTDASESIVLGVSNTVQGLNNVAIGSTSSIIANDGIAIGKSASVTHNGSIALGSGSIADGATLNQIGYLTEDEVATSELNIGDRRITGVSAGAKDTDAVNVKQLSVVNDLATTTQTSLEGLTTIVDGHTEDFADVKVDLETLSTNIAEHDESILDLGKDLTATNTTLGQLSGAFQTTQTQVTELNNFAVRYDSLSDGAVNFGQISLLGNGGTVIKNVANGEAPLDAVNVSQLTALETKLTQQFGNSQTTDGLTKAEVDQIVAESAEITLASANEKAQELANNAEQNAKDHSDLKDGETLASANEKAQELANNAEQNAKDHSDLNDGNSLPSGNDTALELANTAEQNAKEHSDLNDGKTLASANDKALELANTAEQNAKTHSDLNDGKTLASANDKALELANTAEQNANTYTNNTFSNVTASINSSIENVKLDAFNYTDTRSEQTLNSAKEYADAGDIQTLNSAQEYTDQRIESLEASFAQNDRKMNAGIAGAMAMAGLPQSQPDSRGALSIAGATYGGESAYAIGLSTVVQLDKNRPIKSVTIKVGATSDSQQRRGANMGFGFDF